MVGGDALLAAGLEEAAPVVAPVPEQVPGRVLHMDGDLLCYACGGNDDTTVAQSRFNALRRIEQMREMSGSERTVLHLTTSSSTKGDRRVIAQVKPYQGQRDSSRRPRNWGYLRELFETFAPQAQLSVKLWATREADDGMSFAAAHSAYSLNPVVIGSGDKDLRMNTGCWHIDWTTLDMTFVPAGAFEVVGANDKVYGLRWFWLQMLHGDTADNIPGLPRLDGKPVGPVRADKVLGGADTHLAAFDAVRDAYQLEYGAEWADRFAEQAGLLWMRRDAAASIADFLGHMPGLGHPGVEELIAATGRLIERVKEANAEAQKLGGLVVQGE